METCIDMMGAYHISFVWSEWWTKRTWVGRIVFSPLAAIGFFGAAICDATGVCWDLYDWINQKTKR